MTAQNTDNTQVTFTARIPQPPNDTAYVFALVQSGKYAVIAARDMSALSLALTARGYEHILCNGVWENEREPSYLIPHMDTDTAVGCGIAFSQDCVIVNNSLVSCKAPHTVQMFDGSRTLYGDDARAQTGYTECCGIVWSLVLADLGIEHPANIATYERKYGHKIGKSGHGAVYCLDGDMMESPQYTFVASNGEVFADVGYDVCARMLDTGK